MGEKFLPLAASSSKIKNFKVGREVQGPARTAHRLRTCMQFYYTAQWIAFEFGGLFSHCDSVPWQFPVDNDGTACAN